MKRRVAGKATLCRPRARTLPLSFQSRAPSALRRALLGAAAVAAACFLAACGIQGPVEPPRLEHPEQIKDLAVIQQGQSWQLQFTLPRLATDGERLTKPLEIEIFRAIASPGSQSPAQPPAASPWVRFSPAQASALTQNGVLQYSAPISELEFRRELGSTFSFAVRGLTRRFRGGAMTGEFSNVVTAALLDVSGPVEHLRIRPTEKALEVTWSAPSHSLSGGPLPPVVGYRVYRRSAGAQGPFQLRAEASGTSLADTDFQFDQHYSYKVRAMFQQAGTTAASEDSPVVEVTPRDVFPPVAPRNVSAVYAATAVEVTWTANTEADLAGYNVYRRPTGGSFGKVTPQPLRTPIFRDTSVEPDREYDYRVTALDLAGNESAPSAEVKVETR